MHAVVMDRLEEYVAGTLEPAARRTIEEHLNACRFCKEEIRGMREISQLFLSLRPDEVVEPAPGLYARVMEQVGRQKAAAPSFASLFALNFAFGRRLAFSALLTLAILGSYLVSRESAYTADQSPVAVMAQQEAPEFDTAPAPDNMLVTLTAFEQ